MSLRPLTSMMTFNRNLQALLLLATPCVANLAFAEEEEPKRDYALDEAVPVAEDGDKQDGVFWRLDSGATMSFTDNRSVVGQIDGSTFTLGFKLDTDIEYFLQEHEWRNTLHVGAGATRTPVVDDFIKASDILEFQSIYLYHITPWFGPYGQAALETAMFRGTDIRAADSTYLIERPDGTIDPLVSHRLTLSDPFHPLKLKESVGVFFQPYAKDYFTFEVRTGAGVRETLAAQQLAVTDDKDTDEIEVTELRDVFQFGAEAVVELWGDLYENKLHYKASAEAMMPFLNNKPESDDRNSAELTNLSFKVALVFKMVDWASLDYGLRAVREPQLLDEFQIQNNLLLTFGVITGNIKEEVDQK